VVRLEQVVSTAVVELDKQAPLKQVEEVRTTVAVVVVTTDRVEVAVGPRY
jgi:hypothetical protein